ncbi:MAG TPA: Asd/ArgC dimerization domain-containing protein [Thermoanaerobaculia bacterium]|jgi:aspartate-semialdehyde dehydrogenase
MAHPKSSTGYKLGIVNPLTLVGNELKTILRERSFPFAKVVLLDSIGKSGALTEVDDEPAVVAAATAEELEDLDLVFFCGPPAGNRDLMALHRQLDFIAIDLSRPTSAEDGKLTVAGINVDELDPDDLLVSPHPIALPIALILQQLGKLAAIESCIASVVQPASEFGQEAVEELAQQTIAVLNIQPLPQEVFDRQAAFNLYPATQRHEELIVSQVKTLADARTEIALMVAQGTIFHGHTFSLFMRTHEPLEESKIIAALKSNPVFVFPEGDQQFGTVDAAGKDEVLIAEVRAEPSIRGGFWVWAVCDNLRRSSALNAILIAEKALFGAEMAN